MNIIRILTSLNILMFFLLSCNSPTEPSVMEKITFKNETNFQINITITSDIIKTDTKSFSIAANSQVDIKAEYGIVPIFDASVEGNSQLQVYYYETDSFVTISSVYVYEIEYKISGTATSVDVTLNNSNGGTEQYDNVSVPHTYSYKNFNDDFVYISAQNQGESGSVTVKIYHRGALFKSSTSSGAYVIATASGSI